MKKLLYILAVSVLASCAFADFTATDWVWDAPYTDDYFVTDYAPAGFTVGPSYYADPGPSVFDFRSDNVSCWLYNGNDSFTVTFEGFRDNDFNSSHGTLSFIVRDGSWDNCVWYRVPWSGNGAYTFTAEDIFPEWNEGDSIEGLEVGRIDIWVEDTVKWTPRASGRVTVSLNTTEEETEVPEPACAAYGVAGLVSLIGMKRRIKK
ncbi:MAG: hypothetical protein J6X38_00335 [Abditibacteriota bacterium]|nr:hypothetical protein [Abditibacteriota bacterium]